MKVTCDTCKRVFDKSQRTFNAWKKMNLRHHFCSRACVAIGKRQHGHRPQGDPSKIYYTWVCMRRRCNNKTAPDFARYGGAGVKVCSRWNSFSNFLADMGYPPTEKHTLDRINNKKGYCKSNCRWATRKEQARNRQNNHIIKYKNQKRSRSEWAEILQMPPGVLTARLKHLNWPVKKAFETPYKKYDN